jgi:hypothetical protein
MGATGCSGRSVGAQVKQLATTLNTDRLVLMRIQAHANTLTQDKIGAQFAAVSLISLS